jgi:microcystin degradation protein MlrC
MRQGLTDVAAGPICDPARWPASSAAGTAASVTLTLGGNIDMPQINLPGKPLPSPARSRAITDGEFVVTGPWPPARACAWPHRVLDTGALQIVIVGARSEPFDLGVSPTAASTPAQALL